MSICLNLPDAAASCKMNVHNVTSLADRPVVFCITQISVVVKQFKNEGEWFSIDLLSAVILKFYYVSVDSCVFIFNFAGIKATDTYIFKAKILGGIFM